MSQRDAYIDAYPKAKEWKPSSIDEVACRLANNIKILSRREELRQEQSDQIAQEAAWTRKDALTELKKLIQRANKEMDITQSMSGPNVSAIINAVKELNVIYEVAEKTEGGGVLDDILQAVRGITND